MKQQCKVTLKIARQQIEIALPPRKVLPTVIGHPFWFPIWSLGGVLVLNALFSSFPTHWDTFFFLGGWMIFEIAGLYTLLNTYFGKEKLLISKNGLTLGHYILGIGKGKTYDMFRIHDIRLAPSEFLIRGKLWFNYESQTVTCCHNIGSVEAQQLVHQLSDLITFRCPTIETIAFGSNSRNISDPRTMLQNPDVSTLPFPFLQLKQVIIEIETYDFHQVERFLTYAINVLGQTYLKNRVDVHIYGNPERLHVNLRNNLANLCKRVHVHKGDDMSVLKST
jgi:hypothetical protein